METIDKNRLMFLVSLVDQSCETLEKAYKEEMLRCQKATTDASETFSEFLEISKARSLAFQGQFEANKIKRELAWVLK